MALESLFKFNIQGLNESCGLWLYGSPGSGKDCSIYTYFGNDLLIKSLSKYWDGYMNQKYTLISEVEPCHSSSLACFLKIWEDRFIAEVKATPTQFEYV